MKTFLRNNQGIALVVVITIMAILLAITGSALLFSGLGLRTAKSHSTGSAALQAADAGVQHAVSKIPEGFDFSPLLQGTVSSGFSCLDASGNSGACDGITYFPTLTGSINGYTYTVKVENDTTVLGEGPTTDVNEIVILTSTAKKPDGSATRRIRAYVGRAASEWKWPGAVYLPGAPSEIGVSTFDGQQFKIAGKDTGNGSEPEGGGPKPDIPGIATTSNANTSQLINQLSNAQYNNITGQGSDPSISNINRDIDVNKIATKLINLGVEGVDKQTLSPGTYDGSSGNWGAPNNLKITYVTSAGGIPDGTELRLTGNLEGWGVLITDPEVDVHIDGSFKWHGVVITRRHLHCDPNHFGGQANTGCKIWGGVMIPKSTSALIDMGEKSKIYYSSSAIQAVLDKWRPAFPKAAKLIAWHELMS